MEEKKKKKESSIDSCSTMVESFIDAMCKGEGKNDVCEGEKKKMYEDIGTLFQQDCETLREALERGLDVKDSFRTLKLGKEGKNPHFHVFSTEGRAKKVKDDLETMNTSRFVVDNKSVGEMKIRDKTKEEESK